MGATRPSGYTGHPLRPRADLALPGRTSGDPRSAADRPGQERPQSGGHTSGRLGVFPTATAGARGRARSPLRDVAVPVAVPPDALGQCMARSLELVAHVGSRFLPGPARSGASAEWFPALRTHARDPPDQRCLRDRRRGHRSVLPASVASASLALGPGRRRHVTDGSVPVPGRACLGGSAQTARGTLARSAPLLVAGRQPLLRLWSQPFLRTELAQRRPPRPVTGSGSRVLPLRGCRAVNALGGSAPPAEP